MFDLHLFQTERGKERVDVYYSEMTSTVNQIAAIVRNEKPVLYGIEEDEKVLLEPSEIYYFDTVDRRTYAYTKEKVYQAVGSLSALEEELKAFGFIRISKSCLINIYMIRRIKPEANMRITAVLKNDEKLQINRGYKRSFEDYLKQVRKSIKEGAANEIIKRN